MEDSGEEFTGWAINSQALSLSAFERTEEAE